MRKTTAPTTTSASDVPLLWHIPFSHYNEKVRWALDYKGIAHRRRTLGTDYLVRTWRATRQCKLPILWLDGHAIADSTRIIAALEARHPEPRLYPADPVERASALAFEDDLDETLGPAIRAAFVTPMFRQDPDHALRLLLTAWPQGYARLRPFLPVFPMYYRFRHKIQDARLDADRATVASALDRIEHVRQGQRYLFGDTFSVADLTAAALLGFMLQPPELQYANEVDWPSCLRDYRAALLQHPAVQWAGGIYRLHRGRSSEVGGRAAAIEPQAA